MGIRCSDTVGTNYPNWPKCQTDKVQLFSSAPPVLCLPSRCPLPSSPSPNCLQWNCEFEKRSMKLHEIEKEGSVTYCGFGLFYAKCAKLRAKTSNTTSPFYCETPAWHQPYFRIRLHDQMKWQRQRSYSRPFERVPGRATLRPILRA